MPLISVITVTYNAAATLENTIKSVLSQTFKDFEFIIIDGNSTDLTMDIVKKYKSSSLSTVISEPDRGIYDAMNKGIKVAKGSYLFFLGADDVFANEEVLERVSKYIISETLELLVGNIVYHTGRKFHSHFGFKTLLNNTVHHQGAFYNSKLFKEFLYDTNFKLIADYELNLILFKKAKELNFKFIDENISICTDGGASRKLLKDAFNETNEIRKKVLGSSSFYLKWLYTLKFKIQYAI